MKTLFYCILFALSSSAIASETSSIQLVCPPDVWLNCGAEIWDLSSYGTAYYYINGNQYNAGQAEVVYDLTTCQTGKIYRTWSVEDYNWNIISCTQTIFVKGGNFGYHNIDWPESDLQLYGCGVNTHPNNLPYEYSKPRFDYTNCSMVGSSYKDQVFYFGPDCKKILRTWTVLDWCNYYPGNSNPGIWTYTQVIKVSNNDVPQISCKDTIIVNPDNCNGTFLNLQDVSVSGSGCTGEYEVTNDSPYADRNKENASGLYPVGETKINYRLDYACGQSTYCQQVIIVKEKAPVPYCLSQLNVALMAVDEDQDGIPEDGMVELWAKDMNFASYHPCYPEENLRFSFSSNPDSSFVVFTCDNVGLNDMQLWVTDSRGNQSWCAVTVDVQNNAANIPDCSPPDQNLKGVITDSYDQPLSQVYVDVKSRAHYQTELYYDTVVVEKLIDSVLTPGGLMLYMYDYVEEVQVKEQKVLLPGEVYNLLSDEAGYFNSPDLDASRRYTIEAFKFGDNSLIDIEDINILKAYINDELEFKNSYSFISADINEDRKIDEADLDILEQIYMGEEDEWPKERQWIFYDSRSFDNLEEGENPLLYELSETIVLDSSTDRFGQKEFIGVLKGDLALYENIDSGNAIQQRDRKIGDNRFVVYPNPFTEMLYVDNPSSEKIIIELYTLDGKEIYRGTSTNSKVELDLRKVSPGTVVVYNLISSGDVYSGKLLRL